MTWPGTGEPPASPRTDQGYGLRVEVDRVAFRGVQESIGFHVTDGAWDALVANLVDDSMVFALRGDHPVAVAAAERRARWVEIGWVAVDPAHRGAGLGLAVCSQLTRLLIAAGETRLFGSTHDHRLAALKIYFALGFVPVYRHDKSVRWQRVCEQLDLPFAPAIWGWPNRV